MPFFLIVPPTEMITENPELTVRLAAQTKAFREAQGRALGAGKVQEKIASGGFRGTEIVEWKGSFDAILYTAFVLPRGKNQTREFLRLAALLRESDCVNLGARWEVVGEPLKGAPASLISGGVTLDKAASRTLEKQNTYRFDTAFVGSFGSRGKIIMDLVSSERFASGGKPIVSSLGRMFCDAALARMTKNKMSALATSTTAATAATATPSVQYPARAHRVVVFRFDEDKKSRSTLWPMITGTVVLDSGTFAERKRDLFEEKKAIVFEPAAISDKIYAALDPLTHKLTDQVFRILKREGRWIYLDRGRAYGLEIGTHLVGRGAALHVIQYAPWSKELDVAIALVRKEDPGAPLKEGETVTFDPTAYPMGGSGGAMPIPLAPP